MSRESIQEIVCCLGQPVAGNPTQYVMEQAFAEAGLDWRYLTLEVGPADLADAIRGVRGMGFRGCNLTIPHKVAVLSHLDRLSESAALMGAVNCVHRVGLELVGENTDGKGFVESLRQVADPAGQAVVLLGAGGAARAIGVELALAGARQITVVNRSVGRGEELCGLLHHRVHVPAPFVLWEGNYQIPPDAELVVNATSVGLGDPRPAADRPGHATPRDGGGRRGLQSGRNCLAAGCPRAGLPHAGWPGHAGQSGGGRVCDLDRHPARSGANRRIAGRVFSHLILQTLQRTLAAAAMTHPLRFRPSLLLAVLWLVAGRGRDCRRRAGPIEFACPRFAGRLGLRSAAARLEDERRHADRLGRFEPAALGLDVRRLSLRFRFTVAAGGTLGVRFPEVPKGQGLIVQLDDAGRATVSGKVGGSVAVAAAPAVLHTASIERTGNESKLSIDGQPGSKFSVGAEARFGLALTAKAAR